VITQNQVTVRLPAELDRALRTVARRMQRKPSDVVRMALREFLGGGSDSKLRPAERVRGLLGSLSSGVPDLADRHRERILDSLRRGR
jgi:Arc/MetJ-type ribon-helix-helix transcriptional regulator